MKVSHQRCTYLRLVHVLGTQKTLLLTTYFSYDMFNFVFQNVKMFGLVYIVLAVAQLQVSYAACDTDYANSTPVELFQTYLRINTTTHNNLSKNCFVYFLVREDKYLLF